MANVHAAAPALSAGADAADRMDRMYRWQRHIYDATRRPYLLGRDQLIASLAPPRGGAVLEIGCGTGRNLIEAARAWPEARFYGFDVSNVMLDVAAASVRRAGLSDRIRLAQGDALSFDPQALFGVERFERMYFSYVLSMIPAWRDALDHAGAKLAPGGALLIADFGDQAGLPRPFRALLMRWLALFHVHPRFDMGEELARVASAQGLVCDAVSIYRGYATLGALRRPMDQLQARPV